MVTNTHRVLTGITTSGIPHLGNLVGAVLPSIKASKSKNTSTFLFLADYHSLIKNNDPVLTHNSSLEIAACWLACGLDPSKVVFYRQSDIEHIFELAWILSCFTPKGLLNRAHAYKAAIQENEKRGSKDIDKGTNMGLFNYPILMAADILMFQADIVPVGNDQKQHIEMTRDIAIRFNNSYGNLLTIPEAKIDKKTGILPGTDGQKMSKSYNNVIPIFTSGNELNKIIRSIKTNSLIPGQPKDYNNCNIFNIYKAFASEEEIKNFKRRYKDGISWGDAKDTLYEDLSKFLQPFQFEYKKICNEKAYIEETLIKGSKKAKEVSLPLIAKIRKSLGIRGFS